MPTGDTTKIYVYPFKAKRGGGLATFVLANECDWRKT